MITGDLLEVWGFKVQKRPQPEFLGTGEGGGASPPVKAPGCEPNDCHHRRAPRAGPLPLPAVRCPGPPDRTAARGQGAHLRDCHPARGIRAAVSRLSLAIWGSSGSRLPTGTWRALRESRHAAGPTRPLPSLSLIRNWNRESLVGLDADLILGEVTPFYSRLAAPVSTIG
jgi:hypothetical protein